MYSFEEVMSFVEEENVSFIRLAFCDIHGVQKNIAIMPGELRRAFDTGISFDASAIEGFESEGTSDLLLFPDPSTLQILPWRPSSGHVVHMFCDIRRPDGSLFERDGRKILRDAAAEAEKAGIRCNFSTEFEFYLFKTDEDGNPTQTPYDNAGYFYIAPLDRGENIRREICLTLQDMGITPEASHHEEGPGQQEIDFRFADPMTTADNATTFKNVVTTVAMSNGAYADFSPKPLKLKSGSGMHINISVASADGRDVQDAFIAGIMEHIGEITLFLNPHADSYRRLQQVGQAESAIQVRKQLYEKAPDIVIINTPLSDELGTQLAVELADRNLAVLLLVKNDLQDQISYQMEPHGILTLSKPVSGSALIQALSFLRPFRMKLLEMEHQRISLETKMKEIRLVNRAKWLLIAHESMTEAEANRWIEKTAMDACRKKAAIADDITRWYGP